MGDIVQSARSTFFGDKTWVYGQKHGGANNPNAFQGNQADCTYLAYQSNLHAGYNVPYLSTGGLIKNGTISPEAAKYYDVIDAKDARPGDTVYYPKAAQNVNHVMVLTSWDGEAKTGIALGAQSTNTGLKDGIGINGKDSYWKVPAVILRPKVETYVPELDLTGGPGTGISSPRVAAAVNLLKIEGAMEGYRPGIYTDSGGVPTVGNGLALVVNGSKGWTVRSEEEIKGLLRIAGLPESKYDELPLDTLKQAAQDLRSGNTDSAKTRFGDGKNPGTDEFSVSPLQADRLTGAFIVADTTPKLIAGLGGPATYNELANGEFAAIAGGTYQNPNWLKNHPDFVKAFKEGDADAALAAFGTSQRGQAEADAYTGNVNATNDNLGASHPTASTPTSNSSSTDPIAYGDPMGTGAAEIMAVSDGGRKSDVGTTPTPTPEEPTNHTTTGRTYLSRDGASATLPDGTVVNAGVGGQLALDDNGNLVATRPASGFEASEGVVDVIHYNSRSQIVSSAQVQNVPDPQRPNDSQYDVPVQQGEARVITLTYGDGSTGKVNAVFQVGVGWVEPGSGEVVQDIQSWRETPTLGSDDTPLPWVSPVAATGNGPNASDPPAPKNPEPNSPPATTPAAYQTVERDGNTYEVTANGTYDRAVSGHPGWIESRDSTGGGVIMDERGNAVAQLHSGDRVGMTDDGRIAVSDSVGKAVDRSIDASTAGEFAVPNPSAAPESTPLTTLGHYLSGQDEAFNAQANNAASALSLLSSVASLEHWDKLGDKARLGALVGLYNQIDHLGAGLGGSGNNLSGDLGQWGAGLGLITALDGNNPIAQASAGAAFYNTFANTAGSSLTPIPAPFIQALNLMNAIESGNTVSMIASAVAFIPGWGTAASIAISILAPLLADKPPPPAGITHYEWDEHGAIQIRVDQDQSHGADYAKSTAASVQELLQDIVQSINDKNPDAADNVALNPYLLPRVGFSDGHAWLETTLADGGTFCESIRSDNLAQRLLEVLIDNGGIAPVWQVQTQLGHMHQLLAHGSSQADIAAELGAGKGGGAHVGNQAYALEGNAAESADHQSQNYEALVLKVQSSQAVQTSEQALQDQVVQMSTIYKDVENDGYFESTQWVAATDASGNAQGLLVLDYDANGQIETRDILNIGGNGADHAGLQRNNVQWLDANGDGVLDAGDPAFAAIRLWVDVNQDGRLDAQEGQNLQSLQITAIDIGNAQVTYADGHTSALHATDLQSDTEGVRFTQVQVADAQGELHALDAGEVLEHEGYQGQTQIVDRDGTRTAVLRNASFEHNAKRTGDWEGTPEQDAHRHGGGNVNGAPAETTDTGAASFGPVQTQANPTSHSTVDAGDARVVSDAQDTNLHSTSTTQTTIGVGDARLQSAQPGPQTSITTTTARGAGGAGSDARIVYVPNAQGHGKSKSIATLVTAEMIASAQSALFGLDGGAASGLGVLAAVGLGLTSGASAAAASAVVQQQPREVQASEVVSAAAPAYTAPPASFAYATVSTAAPVPTAVSEVGAPAQVWQQVQASQVVSAVVVAQPVVSSGPSRMATVVSMAPKVESQGEPQVLVADTARVRASAETASASTHSDWVLGAPVVQGETLASSEDGVFRLSGAVLLANDSTPNASADPNRPALSITAVANAVHGTVTIDHGDVVFVPDDNFHGVASFEYTVTDQYGYSGAATATLEIAPVNDVPVTVSESARSEEDGGLVFTQAQLLGNDSDVDSQTDGQILRISRVGAAQHGTVWMESNGELRFVPQANYHGAAQFTYWVSDGAGGETPAVVELNITGLNDAPVVLSENVQGDEDTALVFTQAQLLANDSDVDTLTDGQVLRISAVSGAQHGQVSLLGNGDIRFIPDANYHGPAQFTYTVDDGNGGTADATVNVTVLAVNDAPVTQGESRNGTEDITLSIAAASLLANDSDVDGVTDGQVLSLSAVGSAQHGLVRLVSQDGGVQTVEFVPEANYHGVASFQYTVSDGAGGFTTAIATLQIAAVNDAPVTANESAQTDEDTALVFTQAQLLANDSDADVATDGQVLRISAVSGAQHGQVSLLGNGDIRFIPDANYHGPAQFTYTVDDGNGGTTEATVNVTVLADNDAPVTQGEALNGTEDVTLSIAATSLLANDSDVDGVTDGQVLSLSAVGSAQHGTVRLLNLENGTQTVEFVPEANYHGTASFQYTVSDGAGGLTTAIATLQIAAVNDAPVTANESAQTDEDTALVFTQAQLLANDSDADVATDGQVLRISAVSGAQHGQVSLLGNGDIRFIPDANYHGPAQFTYIVDDGNGGTTEATVNVTVLAVNDAPVTQGESRNGTEDITLSIAAASLLANDSDVDGVTDGQVLSLSAVGSAQHGTVRLLNLENGTQTVEFVPEANYHGVASFQYTVSDGAGGFTTAIATLQIAAVNDAPVTADESAQINEDTAIVFTQAQLLANDGDADTVTDGQVLVISRVGESAHGTVSMDGQGQVRFVPDANYHGPAQFSYWVSDGAGGETATTVNLMVLAVNDAPVTQGESRNGTEDITLSIAATSLLANDSDVDGATDGQVLSLSAVGSAQHGTVRLLNLGNGTQTVEFVPDAHYHGTASFQYTVSDGAGGFTTAIATLQIAAVNDAPVTANESTQTDEDTALVFTQAQLLANDSDVDTLTDGQVLRISAVSGAQHGQVSLLGNGDIRFIPDANYHGPAQFTYTVDDGNGGTTEATVNVTVLAVNDAPVATGETLLGTEDVTLSIAAASLLANDSDVDTATDGQTLRLGAVQAIANATHGTVTLVTQENGTQRVDFVPEANYHGTASFQYTVSDGAGGFTTAIATLQIAAVNDAPVTANESSQTDEDTAIVFTQAQLLANDSDADVATDGQVLVINRVGESAHGTVSLDGQGQVRFVPDANYHGAAQFSYWVSDGAGGETAATVNLMVLAANDDPVVTGETVSSDEDVALRFTAATLLANDSDVDGATDGQVLNIHAVGNAQHGTVRLVTQDGGVQTVEFVPEANYHGVASFQYTVNDGAGGFTTSIATLQIAAVNDAPVTLGESTQTNEDTALVFTQAQLLANDSDVDTLTDGQVLRVSAVSGAQHGQVSLLGNGDIQFIPDADYHGPAQFTYTVDDGNGGATDAVVNVMVLAVNDAPVATGEAVSSDEDVALRFTAATLLANESDVDGATDGQVLSLSAVGSAQHGTVRLLNLENGTQTVEFVPEANYHGVASFQYTVSDGAGGFTTAIATLQIAAVNDAPVTVGESAPIGTDTTMDFTQLQLLENIFDADTLANSPVLNIIAVSGAQHGSVSLLDNGDIRFIPNTDYRGPAQFTYTVNNGSDALIQVAVCLTVLPTHDAPVLMFDPATLLATDSNANGAADGRVLSLQAVGSAQHGTVCLITQDDAAQRVEFTPDANFHGVASFQYTVSDERGQLSTVIASLPIAAVREEPMVADASAQTIEDMVLVFTQAHLLGNDSDVDTLTDGQVLVISRVGAATHGTVSLDNLGQVCFVPEANYHGAAQFSYWVSDGAGGETVATVNLLVAAANDAPVAEGETVNTNEDIGLMFNVATLLANDSDVDAATDGQGLSIRSFGNAQHGTVAWAPETEDKQYIVFQPDANFFGLARFDYTVSDGNGGETTTTVVVNVAQTNDAPEASYDVLGSSAEDTTKHISLASLLGNDTDADANNAQWGGVNDVMTISEVGHATHGTVALVNGEVLFTPEANFHGDASFAYTVQDANGASAMNTASFTITAVNDAPEALGETLRVLEDAQLVIDPAALLQNDSDVDVATDGQILNITAVGHAQHGVVVLRQDGKVVFTPEADYFGTASFEYTVSDGNGGSATAIATVELASVNDAPVGQGETVSSQEDQALTILAAALLQNDSDVDHVHSDLRIGRVQSGTGGSATLDANGNVLFTPTANFNGVANFSYWVRDPAGLESAPVTATVVVDAVNDAPYAQGEVVTGASEDAVFRIGKASLLGNDGDVDDANSALSLVWVGGATGGAVSLDANGDVVFTPNANFNGNATFQYRVRDAAGLESPTVQAVIPVAAVNDAPVAVDDQFATYRNSTMTIAFNQLVGNDSDVDGDALTVSAVRDNTNGHASIVNGQVQFVATPGFAGAASFDYLTSDGHGGQVWATAAVNVTIPPNLYPSMRLLGVNFFGTGSGAIDVANASFTPVDDGNAALARVDLLSISVHRTDWSRPVSTDEGPYFPYFAWQPLAGVNEFDASRSNLHIDVRRGYAFDDFRSTWRVTDDRGLSNIWHFNHNMRTGSQSYMELTGYASPVVLALGAASPAYLSAAYSKVQFDINMDGVRDTLAWAAAGSGVLGIDLNGDHRITDASEFAFKQYVQGAQTDLEGLKAFDTNYNGALDAGDAQWAKFGVWEDKNADGQTQDGEYLSLDQLGIASINLQSDGQTHNAGAPDVATGAASAEVVVMGTSSYTRTDGSTAVVADAMFAYQDGDAHTAELNRQAMLFNQVCNTAYDSATEPLGFVPIAPDASFFAENHGLLHAANDLVQTPGNVGTSPHSHSLLQAA